MDEQDIPPGDQTEGGSDPAGSGDATQGTKRSRRKVNRQPTAEQKKRTDIWKQVVVPALEKDKGMSAPQALTLLQGQTGDLLLGWTIGQVQRRMTAHHRAQNGSK